MWFTQPIDLYLTTEGTEDTEKTSLYAVSQAHSGRISAGPITALMR